MPDLYGKKAWVVIGLAVVGWALAVVFMLAYAGMYYTAYHYYLTTRELVNQYKALYENYTALAVNAMRLANYSITVLNYTDAVLAINTGELVGYNATATQYAMLLNETITTLRETDQLLNATVNALNTYNQIMGRLVNATAGGG